jgi:alkylation response protein AidB-like acyl-CoA dehydrogenase
LDFGLSEEQQLLQQTVRRFAEQECPAPKLREIFDGGSGHDAALWAGMAEMGVAGLAVPDSYGGAGLEILDLALVAESLGHAALPGPFLGHSLATLAILAGGTEEQRARWLPRLASGAAIGSVALAEEREVWEPDRWNARPSGSQLSGSWPFVPFGSIADVLVIGVGGPGLVVLERGGEEIKVEPTEGVDRTRRLDRLLLDRARVEPLPGGGEAACRVRDVGLVLLAADAFGGASRLVEMSVEYAKTRVQFDVPIGQFQAVKHKLADMATDVEPARGLYWYAAHAIDRLPAESERAAALAKAHLTDRYLQVAREAVEVHGGIGFTWECDVQIWFKRAMFDRAYLGPPEGHRDRAAALAGW